MPSIIGGALAGLGEQAANIGGAMFKAELDRDARQQDSDLALARAKTLEEFKASRAEAPLLRLSARAKALGEEEVPVEAKAVTKLSGEVPLRDGEMGPAQRGLVGDVAALRAQIDSMPEGADKRALQDQLSRQLSGDEQFERGIVAGKRRKRTAQEALDAAVDEAKANDLIAYAAYEKDIGKPRRDERRVDIQQEREDNRSAAAAEAERRRAIQEARRWEIDVAKLNLQQGQLEATNRKIDAWIENEAEKRDRDAAKGENKPDKLGAIVNAMNNAIRQHTNSDTPRGKTEEGKAEWKRQLDNYISVRDRASRLLDESLTDRGAPERKPKDQPAAPAAPANPKPAGAASAARPPLSSFLKK